MRTTIEDVEIIAVNNHLDLALLLLKHPDDKPFEFSVLENAENIDDSILRFLTVKVKKHDLETNHFEKKD